MTKNNELTPIRFLGIFIAGLLIGFNIGLWL